MATVFTARNADDLQADSVATQLIDLQLKTIREQLSLKLNVLIVT
jgi:hypothetical protein